MRQTGGGSANLVDVDAREIFQFSDMQIDGLNNNVDDDSPEIEKPNSIDDFNLCLSSTSGVKGTTQDNIRKRKFVDKSSDFDVIKRRHMEVMTNYYERKMVLLDLKIKKISEKSFKAKVSRIPDSETSSDSESNL